MSIDIQKWKNEAHENAAKTVANMLQVGIVCMKFILGKSGDFHTRSHFACCTIPEGKLGLLIV